MKRSSKDLESGTGNQANVDGWKRWKPPIAGHRKPVSGVSIDVVTTVDTVLGNAKDAELTAPSGVYHTNVPLDTTTVQNETSRLLVVDDGNLKEEDPLKIREYLESQSVSPASLDVHQIQKHTTHGGKVKALNTISLKNPDTRVVSEQKVETIK